MHPRMMSLPFDVCWERVNRAEFHRQELIQTWERLDLGFQILG
jgi:hypothetical protein